MNFKNFLCAAGSILVSLICAFNRFTPVIIWVVSFSALDLATGLIKAKIKHEISSKRALDGLWKKVALLTALFLGIFLDAALPSLAMGSEYAALADGVIFSSFIGFYIVIGEAISVVENLYECSVPLPSFLIKFLKVCKDKIDSEGENK